MRVSTDNPRGGVNVHVDLSSAVPLQQSPAWISAGRSLALLRLAPHCSMALPAGQNYIKVILGRLANPARTCLAAPFAVRSTLVREREVTAAAEGALFALMTLADDAPKRVGDMAALAFTGEQADHLVWRRFDEKFGDFTDLFDGQDCHMADGLHLLDEQGREFVYINFWTCGKGVDLSTHNHSNPPSPLAPAFAEVHWVLSAGTETGGMYETAEPGARERVRHPMALGDEHGPFYDRDGRGRPVFRENGAVSYPWHGWQGGTDGLPGQSYDFVAAFEIDPAFVDASPQAR